jgi:type I restriction enzyme S subunit
MSFPRYPTYKPSGVEWLGEVPEHWKLVPIKRILQSIEQGWSPQCEAAPAEPGEWGVLKVGCVNGGKFNPDENKALPRELLPDERLGIRGGDVLVSRANTRELIGSVAMAERDYPNILLCDKLYRLRTDQPACSPAFLARYLASDGARNVIETSASGASSSMLNIGQSVIINMPIALPSASEQAGLIQFLDRETAKIDALIAEQQRLIELLQEKRQAVISHAVTKGLNPDAPMKDSGVEWLGEVPEHWIITRLGRMSTSRCDGPFGSGLKSEHYVDSGVLVVRLQNIKNTGYDSAVSAFIDKHYYSERLGDHDVEPGDLLIAGLGDDKNYVGRACMAPDGMGPAMVKADCFRFRLASEVAAPEFIASSLNASAAFHAGTLSSGSTRSRIPLSVMATREIALPPLEEQIEIVSSIKSKLSEIDQLQREDEAATVLLQERRSALISAAVTGQIDVRGLVAEDSAA